MYLLYGWYHLYELRIRAVMLIKVNLSPALELDSGI